MSPGGDKPQFEGGRHLARIQRQRRRSWWLLWLTLACAVLFAFGAAESAAEGVHVAGQADQLGG
jgi:predicted Zn-dependent protease